LDNENEESKETTDVAKKKRNKKKKKTVVKNSAIQVQKIAGFFEKNKKSSSQVSKSEKPDDLLQFSNERLKAYGVNPNQFKRKLKKEKFRNLMEGK